MASTNANPIEMPETDITMFDTEHDYKTQSNFAEPPQPSIKNDNDFEDLDPVDEEELLIPSKPIRVRRVAVFRPLFVYRQEQAKQQLIGADRRRGRATNKRPGNGQGQRRPGNGQGQRRDLGQTQYQQHGY